MELEIKVMWCKGLTAFNFFQKLTVYAAVSITSHERIQLTQDEKQEQKTPVDKKSEQGHLEWNYPMKFDLRPFHKINLDMNYLSLLFELRSTGQILGDKTIGQVRVPLQELIQSVGSEAKFVKYEVRNLEGKHNGVLDFSYKLVGNVLNTTSMLNPQNDVQITSYNHHQQLLHQNNDHFTTSNVPVIGYTHDHHQQLDESRTNTENYIIRDQSNHQHTYYGNHLNESFSISNPEMIQYPKIDLDELSVLPLVYPPPSSYNTSFSSFTRTNAAHYYHSAVSNSPPSSQMWPPTHLLPSHYPPLPPLLQMPCVYPPQPPQGNPHWGYTSQTIVTMGNTSI